MPVSEGDDDGDDDDDNVDDLKVVFAPSEPVVRSCEERAERPISSLAAAERLSGQRKLTDTDTDHTHIHNE